MVVDGGVGVGLKWRQRPQPNRLLRHRRPFFAIWSGKGHGYHFGGGSRQTDKEKTVVFVNVKPQLAAAVAAE